MKNIENENQITQFDEKCIIIKIRDARPSVYERVRRCWAVNLARASKADYVLAVINGRVEGVYKPVEWYITFQKENCNETYNCENFACNGKRKGFFGEEANKDIKRKYLNKYIPKIYMRPGPGPIQYTY